MSSAVADSSGTVEAASPVGGELIATVDPIAFVARGWEELRVGDVVYSLSGTHRTILDVSLLSNGHRTYQFETRKKPGGSQGGSQGGSHREHNGSLREQTGVPSREQVSTTHMALSNLRRVIRHNEFEFSRTVYRSWRDVRAGDVVELDSGDRKLVTEVPNGKTSEPISLLARDQSGQYDHEIAAANERFADQVVEVCRWTPKSPTIKVSTTSLSPSTIFNIETLLGKGEVGDQFVMAMCSSSVPVSANGIRVVPIMSALQTQMFQFAGFSHKAAHTDPVDYDMLLLRVLDDGNSPFSVTGLVHSRTLPAQAVTELTLAAMLSNSLKGVGFPRLT